MKKLFTFLMFLFASFTSYATNYYWIGGSGNWSDVNHWSTSSGGTNLHAIVPSSGDDVFFDANSGFTSGSKSINIDITANCRNLTIAGSATPPVISGTGDLNIFGSSIMQAGMTYFVAKTTFRPSSPSTILSNGVHWSDQENYEIYVDGTAELTLQDDFTTYGHFIFDRGTVNTNNQKWSINRFTANPNGNTKTLKLTASEVYINLAGGPAFNSSDPKLTINPGTSHIHVTGGNTLALPTFITKGTDTFYNLTFENSIGGGILQGAGSGSTNFNKVEFKGNGIFTGNNTYKTLKLGVSKTYQLDPTYIQVVTNLLSSENPACQGFITLKSSSSNANAVISSPAGAVVAVYNTIIEGITAQGGASFTATNSVDAGNNAGWVFTVANGKDLYWVGGDGTWNDIAHWSDASGGAGGFCVPGPGDNVFIDAGSGFNGSSAGIAIPDAGYCRNITVNGSATPPIIRGNGTLNIYGSSVLQAGMTYDVYTTNYRSSNAETITSNGVSMPSSWLLTSVIMNGSGSWTLQDDFLTKGRHELKQGTFSTNNFSWTANDFYSLYGPGTRTLNLGSSQVYFTSPYNQAFSAGGTTINAGTSHIHVMGVAGVEYGPTFNVYGSEVLYDVTFEEPTTKYNLSAANSGTRFNNVVFKGNADIYGSMTYEQLALAPGKIYQLLLNNSTQNVNTNFSANNPACDGYITLKASDGVTANIVSPASAAISVNNVVISGINVSGGANFLATNSVDQGGNSGWSFVTTAGKDLYWVNGSGTWNEVGHWSLVSGGSGGDCVPGPLDNVFIDAGSGLSNSNTITIPDYSYCRNITVAGSTTPPTIRGLGSLNIYGSSVMQNGMTYDVKYTNYRSTQAETITSNGAIIGSNYQYSIFLAGTGSWTLLDEFKTGMRFVSKSGTFNTNDKPFTVFSFQNEEGGDKFLNLGSSKIYINAPYNIGLSTNLANTTVNAGTSHIHFKGTLNFSGPQVLAKNGDTFYNVTFEEKNLTPRFTVDNNGTANFHKVEFKGNGEIFANAVYDTLILNAGKTYTLKSGSLNKVKKQLYASGNPCLILFLQSSNPGTQANICVESGNMDFNFANVKDMNASCNTLSYGSGTTNSGNNSNINFAPYVGGEIIGLGPDQSVPCTAYPIVLNTDGFFGNPNTKYTWQDNSTASNLTITEPGTYRISVDYGESCVVPDAITFTVAVVPAALVATGSSVSTLNICEANGYSYYRGDGTNLAADKAYIAINPNGNIFSPTSVTGDNSGNLTGGAGTFTNTGNGYYQSTDGTKTFRISKRLYSINAPGSYTTSGGVKVRIYYADADIAAMQSDALPANNTIGSQGWFKYANNTASGTVAALTPAGLSASTALTPTASGTENGLNYVEFLVESFSTFGYFATTSSSLPVQLISFNATPVENAVELKWATSQELNSSYFEVQRSTDSKNWNAVEKVSAKESSKVLQSYKAMDSAPLQGLSYYRLKMVDLDDTYAYSTIKQVNMSANHPVLYPNPATTYVQVPGIVDQKVDIYNTQGALYLQVQIKNGRINTEKLIPGVYMLRTVTGQGTTTVHKFVIGE